MLMCEFASSGQDGWDEHTGNKDATSAFQAVQYVKSLFLLRCNRCSQELSQEPIFAVHLPAVPRSGCQVPAQKAAGLLRATPLRPEVGFFGIFSGRSCRRPGLSGNLDEYSDY